MKSKNKDTSTGNMKFDKNMLHKVKNILSYIMP